MPAIDCSASALSANAECWSCALTPREHAAAQTYLLTQIALSRGAITAANSTPEKLVAAAACYNCTLTPKLEQAIQIYLLCSLLTSGATAEEVAYSGFIPGTLNADETGCSGFEFTTDIPITVTSVGRYFIPGNSKTHFVGIYALTGALIGGVTVNVPGGTPGTFVYADLVTPLALTAGTHYVIASQEYPFPNGEQFYEALDVPPGTIPTGVNSHITIVASRLSLNCGVNTFVGSGVFGVNTYGPVNFKFTE